MGLARSSWRLVVTSTLALSWVGCAPPPFSVLMAQHRDGEALCRASTPEEARLVIPRMIGAVKPEWRVQRVKREDLPDLDEVTATELFGRYVFATIETTLSDQDGKPTRRVVRFEPELTAEIKIDKLADKSAVDVWGPAAFTRITGEKEPTYETGKEIVSEPWRPVDLLTLGVARLWAKSREEDVTKISPDYAVERDAPKSAALYRAFERRFGNIVVYVIPRARKGNAKARVTSELEIVFSDSRANECFSSLHVTLHGEPFDLESDDWPDAARLVPFPLDSWEGAANVSGRWRTALGSHEAELEIPSAR